MIYTKDKFEVKSNKGKTSWKESFDKLYNQYVKAMEIANELEELREFKKISFAENLLNDQNLNDEQLKRIVEIMGDLGESKYFVEARYILGGVKNEYDDIGKKGTKEYIAYHADSLLTLFGNDLYDIRIVSRKLMEHEDELMELGDQKPTGT